MTFDNNTCNRDGCGKPIVWVHPLTGQTSVHPETGRNRPMNPDGSLHKCMFKGQKQFFEKKPKGERLTDYNKKENL